MSNFRNIALDVLFFLLEIMAGIFTGSLAIISDALYNLKDIINNSLSINFKGQIKANKLFHSLLLVLILLSSSINIIYNAITRFFYPVHIYSLRLIFFSFFCVLFSFVLANILKEEGDYDTKRFFRWLMIFICSIFIKIFNIEYLDSLIALIISIILIQESFKEVSTISGVLSERDNKIDEKEVTEKLLKIEGIENIHLLHIWKESKEYAISMHVKSKNKTKVNELIEEELEKMNIKYKTIKYEKMTENCNFNE